MDRTEKKMFISLLERIITTRIDSDGKVDQSEVHETRRLALNLIYKKSPAATSYIDTCMTVYARAVMEDKADMLIDGMKKLYELIFGPEEKEEMPCTKKTDEKS